MANHNLKITLTNTRTQLPIYNCRCYIKVNSWYNSATGPIEPDIDSETSAHIFVNGKDYTTWSVSYYRYPKNITLVKVTSLDYNVTFDAQTVEISYSTDSSGNTSGTAAFSVSATSALGGTPSWSVRVLDGYSNPIPEASVSFPLKSSSGSMGISGIIVKTDDKGIATYTGESSTADTSSNISISKDGYKSKTTTWPDENGTITVILESTAIHVFGHVYDYVTRKGRSGVTVKYITRKAQIGTATVVQTTETNSDGYYSFIISSTPGAYNFIEIQSSNVAYTLIGSSSILIGSMTSGSAYERDFLVQSMLVGDPYTGYSSPNSREDNWTPFKEFLVVKYNQELLTEKDYDPWQTIPHKIARKYLTYKDISNVKKIVTLGDIKATGTTTQYALTNGDKKWTLNYTYNDNSYGSLAPGESKKFDEGTVITYTWTYNGTTKFGGTEKIIADKTLIYENGTYYYEDNKIHFKTIGFTGNNCFILHDGWDASAGSDIDHAVLGNYSDMGVTNNTVDFTPTKDLTIWSIGGAPGQNYCLSSTDTQNGRISSKPTTYLSYWQTTISRNSLEEGHTYYLMPYSWTTGENDLLVKMTNNATTYNFACVPVVGRTMYEAGELRFTNENQGVAQAINYSGLKSYADSVSATEVNALFFYLFTDNIFDNIGSGEDSRLFNVYIDGNFDDNTAMNSFVSSNEFTYTLKNPIKITDLQEDAITISIVIEEA